MGWGITRRRLLTLGVAGAVAAVGGWQLLGVLKNAARPQTRSYWFERVSEFASNDDVVELKFVDEFDRPVDFNALLVWEPDGVVEEVAVKDGVLRLDKRRVKRQAESWVEEQLRRDNPTSTEHALFTILPTAPAEPLFYTDVIERPALRSRVYRVRGAARRSTGHRFATCPEAKVFYISDVNLTDPDYVPAVALKDSSSKAFGEDIWFGYKVDGSALKLNAYGALSLKWGTELRITGEYSWGTGNLISQGSGGYAPADGQSAAVMFYSSIWRVIGYDVYDIYTCNVVDTRASLYMLNLAFENGNIALRSVGYIPKMPTSISPAETRTYTGIDGKLGDYNTLWYLEIMKNEPLLDVGGTLGVGLPVGDLIANKVPSTVASLIKKLYAGFNFQAYGAVANYIAKVSTDAAPGAKYALRVYRAAFVHYLKDYVFKPLVTIAEVVDA
ncbi:conserved hypothetical protein [Pyrobaculum islandicum DSM 4184]|uniref:Uncharacterized protein n=1 Tax=Pyrobaculum islandicum (strain DSM 4184 / JCM 9189 / GEO3) TaxID=384616 RepID=A1RQP9_PYRIL|nr:hypothetical protein [Pyrobaculum islandicum]ABL87281.1 conserved hypothetical protein [Pyrobaculum islandicum DSM 4184]